MQNLFPTQPEPKASPLPWARLVLWAWSGGWEETRKPGDSFSLEFDLKQDWKGRKESEQKCRQEGAVNEPFFLFGDRAERIAGRSRQLSSERLSEVAAVSGCCLLCLLFSLSSFSALSIMGTCSSSFSLFCLSFCSLFVYLSHCEG